MCGWFRFNAGVICVCYEQETMEKNKLDHAEEIQRVQKDHTVQLEVNFCMCDLMEYSQLKQMK